MGICQNKGGGDAGSDGCGSFRADAVIVHPSGILGPYNGAKNYLCSAGKMTISGKLPACVHGRIRILQMSGMSREDACGRHRKAGRGVLLYCLTGTMKSRKSLKWREALLRGKISTLPALIAKAAGSLDLPDRQAEEETGCMYQILFIRALTSNKGLATTRPPQN